jgi:hypothetical protein
MCRSSSVAGRAHRRPRSLRRLQRVVRARPLAADCAPHAGRLAANLDAVFNVLFASGCSTPAGGAPRGRRGAERARGRGARCGLPGACAGSFWPKASRPSRPCVAHVCALRAAQARPLAAHQFGSVALPASRRRAAAAAPPPPRRRGAARAARLAPSAAPPSSRAPPRSAGRARGGPGLAACAGDAGADARERGDRPGRGALAFACAHVPARRASLARAPHLRRCAPT